MRLVTFLNENMRAATVMIDGEPRQLKSPIEPLSPRIVKERELHAAMHVKKHRLWQMER